MDKNLLKNLTSELKAQLKQALKGKMVNLILFGSFARGDYAEGSDVDFVLLLNEKLSKQEEEKLSEISAQLSLKYDTVVMCLEYLKEDFEKSSSPFIQNVKREGIRI